MQPTGAETVTVDSKVAGGARTARIYKAGMTLHLTVAGTYAFATGKMADAECTSTVASPSWHDPQAGGVDAAETRCVTSRSAAAAGPGRRSVAARRRRHHTYTLSYTPGTTGPLSFGVGDTSYGDNSGTLAVTVVPVG